jgi:hypothetical protein
MTSVPIVGVRDAIVDGVDVDIVAAAVCRCSGVEDLLDGPPAAAATYLPGRRVNGVRVDSEVVAVQVRARWGYSVPEIAAQIQAATASLTPRHRVDVIVADVGDPPPLPTAKPTGEPVTVTRPAEANEGEPWTSNESVSGPRGEHSLAPIIPIAAATRTPSSPA